MAWKIGLTLVVLFSSLAALVWPSQSSPQAPTAPPSGAPPAANLSRDPLSLVPAEALLAWKALPPPDAPPPSSQPSVLGGFLKMMERVSGSPLKPMTRVLLGVAETFGTVLQYPFALALIDAGAGPTKDGKGRKLENLQVALIVDMNGRFEPMRAAIQSMLNAHTDAGQATLLTHRAGEWTYQELTEKRLEEWSPVAWGSIGEHFVITVGEGVWPRVAQTASGESASLVADDWIRDARAKHNPEPLIEILVAADAIRARLDPLVGERASGFFSAWDARDLRRAYWALGFEGPSLFCVADFLTGDEPRRRVYAHPRFATPEHQALIPEGARSAIYRLPVASLLPQLFASWYATCDPDDRAAAEKLYAEIQARYKFDAKRDLLDQLGNTLVLHNYPQHPLRLPLAFTTLIEIRGDAKLVRSTVDTVCQGWKEGIDAAAESNPELRSAVLERDDDGVWSFQFAVVSGLAWKVTDKYLVVSWSPTAVRDYLDKLAENGVRP